jgi:hypothetical protein
MTRPTARTTNIEVSSLVSSSSCSLQCSRSLTDPPTTISISKMAPRTPRAHQLAACVVLVAAICQCQPATASNVKYVNPLLGTDRPSSAEYGGMIPSTGVPFGMTRWTPYTQINVVGTCPYLFAHNVSHGFLATHQPAVW